MKRDLALVMLAGGDWGSRDRVPLRIHPR